MSARLPWISTMGELVSAGHAACSDDTNWTRIPDDSNDMLYPSHVYSDNRLRVF